MAKEEEEVEEEEDLNVTSSDQPPSIVSSPVPADAAMRPKANAEESEEPEPEPQPEPQPPPQPKKPVAIPASSPARSGTVRRGRANVNRKVPENCLPEPSNPLCLTLFLSVRAAQQATP